MGIGLADPPETTDFRFDVAITSRENEEYTMSKESFDSRRRNAFANMFAPTQKVARKLHAVLKRDAVERLLLYHKIGCIIREVHENQAVYNSDAMLLIGEFTGIPGGASELYRLRLLADDFDREFLEEQASIPMDNGATLTADHFFLLHFVPGSRAKLEMLDRVRQECWSTKAFKKELIAKGHLPEGVRLWGI
jgi:hypothetical protein